MSGFCQVVDVHQGGSATNKTKPSSLQRPQKSDLNITFFEESDGFLELTTFINLVRSRRTFNVNLTGILKAAR